MKQTYVSKKGIDNSKTSVDRGSTFQQGNFYQEKDTSIIVPSEPTGILNIIGRLILDRIGNTFENVIMISLIPSILSAPFFIIYWVVKTTDVLFIGIILLVIGLAWFFGARETQCPKCKRYFAMENEAKKKLKSDEYHGKKYIM